MRLATVGSFFAFFLFAFTITGTLRESKPPPTLKFETKVIWDWNPDFRINPDPDVRRISPKMSWMHYVVGTSQFAKCGTNR